LFRFAFRIEAFWFSLLLLFSPFSKVLLWYSFLQLCFLEPFIGRFIRAMLSDFGGTIFPVALLSDPVDIQVICRTLFLFKNLGQFGHGLFSSVHAIPFSSTSRVLDGLF